MKNILVMSSREIASRPLPGPSAVIRIVDDAGLLDLMHDPYNAAMVLTCNFEDRHGDYGPSETDAKRIAEFAKEALNNPAIENIVCQCQAGVGRSVAVAAALSEVQGKRWENMAVYNRTLYRLLLAEFGMRPMPEPRVSLAVRVKYDAETLMGFLISLRKQRYDNWEAVLFTDGPRPDVRQLVDSFPTGNLVVMETPEPKGRWGHPYRGQALEICLANGAEWIGTNNDDNYLCPGYIEQMVRLGQRSGAPLVTCSGVHRYSAWGTCPPGTDLALWLARRELIEQVPWEGDDFLADERYFQRLASAAGGNVAAVPRALVVKN